MSSLKSYLKAIMVAGLVAGTLDGLAAALLYVIRTGKDPLNVFRFIASGVFGIEAFTGGVPMALWGIFFHFVIATGWALLFFSVYTRLALLGKNKFISGVGYGVFVWLMMNLVVVPLSKVQTLPMTLNGVLTGMVVLMLCIGLPIAFLAGRFFAKKSG
jgi:hypothetical protein